MYKRSHGQAGGKDFKKVIYYPHMDHTTTSTTKNNAGSCESCMMPFSKDTGMRENERYCSYCFTNGKLCYEGSDVKGFKKAMVDAMVARGESRFKAKLCAFMAGFAPRWRGNGSTLGAIFGAYGKKCGDTK